MHILSQGDRRTPLGVQLTQNDEAVDLTGHTVQFGMARESDDTTKVELAEATVVDAEAGTVQYAWAEADVDEAGDFYGCIVVTNTSTGKVDTFPAENTRFQIRILPAFARPA